VTVSGDAAWPKVADAVIEAEEHTINGLAILQLGYKRNKMGYKFTEVEDDFPAFLAAHTIFKKEVGRQDPPRRTYPISVSLNINPTKE
jgi:hypothetical protein